MGRKKSENPLREDKQYAKRKWKEYYAKNKVKERERQLKHHFGITLLEYDLMLKFQNESCAICFIHRSETKKGLMVDHCHKTGKVRGLLCSNCNVAIGLLKENVESLRRAEKYLDLHQS